MVRVHPFLDLDDEEFRGGTRDGLCCQQDEVESGRVSWIDYTPLSSSRFRQRQAHSIEDVC